MTAQTQTPAPDSPEYIAMMVSRAEGRDPAFNGGRADEPPADTPAPPAEDQGQPLILGKFKTQADLEAAYKALESRLGQPKPVPAEGKGDPAADKAAKGDLSIEQVQAQEAVANAGLDYDSLAREYAESGALAEESYARLEKAGIPKAMVDQFIAGQQALASQRRAEVLKDIGGEEAYASMVGWAAKALSADEISAYNAAVNSGNIATIRFAIKGLEARFQTAKASDPQQPAALIEGDASPRGEDVYADWREVMLDMAKPEYERDPRYRARIEQKIARSSLA